MIAVPLRRCLMLAAALDAGLGLLARGEAHAAATGCDPGPVTIHYRGRDVRVRTADGIHLNVSGRAIAAKIVADVLRGR